MTTTAAVSHCEADVAAAVVVAEVLRLSLSKTKISVSAFFPSQPFSDLLKLCQASNCEINFITGTGFVLCDYLMRSAHIISRHHGNIVCDILQDNSVITLIRKNANMTVTTKVSVLYLLLLSLRLHRKRLI